MFLSVLVVLVLSVADYVEVGVSYNMELLNLRMVVSIIGYILRSVPLYLMLLCVRNKKLSSMFMAIPLVINTVVLLITPFTGSVFAFNEFGSFARGPLGYVPHIVGIIYLIMVAYCALRMFYDRYINEGFILLFMEIIACIAVYMETFSSDKIYVSTAYAIFNILYYMFIHVQVVSKDQLTGLLNRASFYEDCHRYRSKISGLVSVDMNELKWINDNFGHEAGDKALIAVAECIKQTFGRKYPVYRLGGDEFTVMIWTGNEIETDEKIALCRKNLEERDYSCAFGTAYFDKASEGEIDINKLLKKADEQMYMDKERIKKEAVLGNRKLHIRE
ncbi:MAG: GGDEF domain-containing protein [Lachnospiraceae bacterium]|nr:GGDEF domain-containing protein [Lachnospiraceae bacterium]